MVQYCKLLLLFLILSQLIAKDLKSIKASKRMLDHTSDVNDLSGTNDELRAPVTKEGHCIIYRETLEFL